MISAVLVEAGVYKNGNMMKLRLMNLLREDMLWTDKDLHRFTTKECEGFMNFSQKFRENNAGYTINKKTQRA